MEIPVYLFAGFLDSGKTNFINGILEDGFAREDKTLLLCCEEGVEEYDPRVLDNVTVVTVEEEEDLTEDFLKQCEKKYRPKQVLVEFNRDMEVLVGRGDGKYVSYKLSEMFPFVFAF